MPRICQFLINTSHYQNGTNQFKYDFPQGRTLTLSKKDEIAVSSCSLYNSTFNIKAAWGNNQIVILTNLLNLNYIPSSFLKGTSYTDPVSGLTINRKYVIITIEDGYWDIGSLELYMQNKMQLLGFYLQSTDANYYFVECLVNAQRYAAQLNLFTIPSVLPTGYSLPTNACFELPATDPITPFVYFPCNPTTNKYSNLGRVFGFSLNKVLPYDPLTQNNNDPLTDSYNISDICPTVSPISTYILCCNIVSNPLSIPDNVLTQLNLGQSKFGGIIPYNDFPQFITANPQQASSIIISLYDENYQPLEIKDPQFSLVLSIKFDQ